MYDLTKDHVYILVNIRYTFSSRISCYHLGFRGDPAEVLIRVLLVELSFSKYLGWLNCRVAIYCRHNCCYLVISVSPFPSSIFRFISEPLACVMCDLVAVYIILVTCLEHEDSFNLALPIGRTRESCV